MINTDDKIKESSDGGAYVLRRGSPIGRILKRQAKQKTEESNDRNSEGVDDET